MGPNIKLNSTSSELHTIVIVQSPRLNPGDESKGKQGFYADNLAFEHEELITRNAGEVYHRLSEPKRLNGTIPNHGQPISRQRLFLRAVISGCLLAISILMFYLWLHVRYVNPMITEITKANPVPVTSSSSSLSSASSSSLLSRAAFMSKISTFNVNIGKSSWSVDYDLPPGLRVLIVNAKDIYGEEKSDIICPLEKFALALKVESDAYLAENWLQACGDNVAYFRIDGDQSPVDIDRLIKYLKNANYLPLKASLNVEKGADILDNEDFQRTRKSDEIIRNVEISGYVTPQTIEKLVEVVPYAEELTIKGDAVCNSLKRSRQGSVEGCQLSWQVLQKLHIVETGACLGMFDLIYSCWDMPSIETLQVRKSSINDPNANFIKGILDKNRILRVDFADNVCFGNTLLDYPFMCQPSS